MKALRYLALALALFACTDDDEGLAPTADGAPDDTDAGGADGPYGDVELTREIQSSALSGEVHVVRDELGIPHIRAESAADLFFVQGYVSAHDRLPQMDLLRRSGAGTLSELYGSSTVEQDLEMRMHMLEPLARESVEALRDSDDPKDGAIVDMLERYTEGVNAYAEALKAGDESVHPSIRETWDPDQFEPWTATDSLIMGRLMAFDLSFRAPREIADTEAFQAALATYGNPTGDAALAAREGAQADLLRIQPVGRTPTIDGVPGLESASSPSAAGERPRAPQRLLERAAATFSAEPAAVAARPYRDPDAGSNTWALAPSVTGASAILAGDQHLQLRNPSIFYPTHLIVPGELDVEGITFPGIPGIVLGHNGKVAWSSTTVRHDVTDVYLESVVACSEGEGDCVEFEGGEVPIETRTETIQIGALGTIIDSFEVDYEVVPHHGPIVPAIEDGAIVPRDGDEALSIRYTGYEPSFEIRAIYDLMTTETVDDAFEALESFQFGAQSFHVIDSEGNIGWSMHADIPRRADAAHGFHPLDNPQGAAPWMILPGDGSAEWEGFLATEDIPRVKNPEQGYLVTANGDPFGLTFDGDPLNGPTLGDIPFYLNAYYNDGLRAARITEQIRERIDDGLPVGLEDTIEAQHDVRSTYGAQLKPHLDEAFALLDEAERPADVEAYVTGLDADRLDSMRGAAEIVGDWSLETPAAVGGDATAQAVTDSAATTIFNAWMHFFMIRALDDEVRATGLDGVFAIAEEVIVRPAVALLAEPESLASGLAGDTGQPILCDDMETGGEVESCDRIALEALERAVEWAESEDGFGTDDPQAWRWGERHTLSLEPLVPNQSLVLGPFPRAGANSVVNVAPTSFSDLSMEQRPAGPAQRLLVEAVPGLALRAKIQLPGGAVYDPDSPYYRNLLDDHYLPEVHADYPYTRTEIVEAGAARWLIEP